MRYLCHRGLWSRAEEQNTLLSFERAFEAGFGIETDVRDCLGELVISHDPPMTSGTTLRDVLQLHHTTPSAGPLALNVKCDGLQSRLHRLLAEFPMAEYFVFDMSVPDTLGYLNQGIRTFTRQSEFERTPAFYEQAKGVWLDCFSTDDWIAPSNINLHLGVYKQVAIVSPELHKRQPEAYWHILAEQPGVAHWDAMLCTDRPMEAKAIINP